MSISKQLAVVLCLLSVGAWARAEEVYVDNVVIILDASGSMRGAMKGSSMSLVAISYLLALGSRGRRPPVGCSGVSRETPVFR